jgi:hypothetical protein
MPPLFKQPKCVLTPMSIHLYWISMLQPYLTMKHCWLNNKQNLFFKRVKLFAHHFNLDKTYNCGYKWVTSQYRLCF